MKLKLTGIKYKNIREFDELSLNFGDQSTTNHISLVQMPNGTGKTTTLNLLRKIIYGKELTEDEVSSYEPKNSSVDEGEFEVDFLFNENPFTLRLSLDYLSKDYEYKNSKPRREAGGMERGHWLPEQLQYLIDKHFTNLFVFNGEFAQELLDRSKMRAENAIKSMYFLNTIEEQKEMVEDRLDDIYTSKAKQSAKTQQGLKNLKTRKDNARKKLKGLKAEKKECKSKIDELEESIEKKQKQKEELLKGRQDLISKNKELGSKIENIQNKIKNSTLELMDHLRRPTYFSMEIREDLENLFKHMDILKLPKSTSTEFFSELANRSKCICGREMDEEASQKVKENAEKYLSEEDISILNALKSQLRDIPEYKNIESRIDELGNKKEKIREKRQRSKRLENKLDPRSREKAKELRKEIKEKKRKKKDFEDKLKKITTNDRSFRDTYNLNWKDNIPLCNGKIGELNKKIESAVDVVNLREKGSILKKIMEEVTEKGLEEIKEQIVHKANERIEKVLDDTDIKISKIDRAIYIEEKEDVSTGQRLSVAYSFLSTLFDESNLDFPFIVDNPATSIDLKVRPQVAKMVPNLFNQLVIFMISPERENFVSSLDSNGEIGYYTVCKKGKGQEMTVDMEKELFMEFQSEEEK